MTIHLIIDTSVLHSDLHLKSHAFRSIERLAQAGMLKLYMPEMVEKEIKSHIEEYYINIFMEILNPINRLTRQHSSIIQTNELELFLNGLKSAMNDYPKKAVAAFEDRLKGMDCEHVAFSLEQLQKAMENYCSGNPPFHKKRHRDDIPDALILEAIKEILRKQSGTHIIVADNRLRKACESLGAKVYSKYNEFLGTSEFQELLCEDYELANTIRLIAHLPNANLGAPDWDEEFTENLVYTSFWDDSLPSDDNEGIIVSAYEPHSVEMSVDAATYHGDGMILIPVSINVVSSISYTLFKGELQLLDDSRLADMYISERNDHYYEIQEEMNIVVEGDLILELDGDELRSKEFNEDELIEKAELANLHLDPDFKVHLKRRHSAY